MDLFARTQWLRENRWTGYAFAVGGALAGIGARFALGDALTGFPFITFFPGVLLAALLGGVAPGALAAVLSGLLSMWFPIAPSGLSVPWPSGWIGLISFAAVSATMTLLTDSATRTSTRLAAATAHDFNNMLSIIMGSLEIARRRMMQGRTDIDCLLCGATAIT